MTTDHLYDRVDQLAQQAIAGVAKSFGYDRCRNVTSSWGAASAHTTYGYDEASRLVAINPLGGAGPAIAFTTYALDRDLARIIGGSTTDTYGYLAASDTAYLTVSAHATRSLLDADGTRLASSAASSRGCCRGCCRVES